MPPTEDVRYLVADTETTGIGDDDKIVEVGWVEIDADFNVLSERESLIDPQCMISPSASGVHGLVNSDLENSPTIEEFFSADDPSCYGKKIEQPVVLIGHRISFDHRFLKPYITNVVQELCTLRWARRLYPEADDHKLTTLMYALGLPRPMNAHRVMSDVYSALELAKHICARTGMSLSQLTEASAAPMLVDRYPFGKHKGDRIEDIPKSYLRWAANNLTGIDMDLQYTIDNALQNKKNK